MCALCSRYGRRVIKDEGQLRKALEAAGTFLHLSSSDEHTQHVLDFIDKVSLEEAPYDPERDALWQLKAQGFVSEALGETLAPNGARVASLDGKD